MILSELRQNNVRHLIRFCPLVELFMLVKFSSPSYNGCPYFWGIAIKGFHYYTQVFTFQGVKIEVPLYTLIF